METKLNSGAIFKNNKSKETQPDYRGTINVDGADKEILLWVKESAKGVKYFSAVIKEPFVKDVTNVKKIVENNFDNFPF